ncbi:MAG: hypothetical protein WC535_07705 [Candidatus Cloacimonas sp.]
MKKQQNPKAKKPTGRPRIELDPKQAKIFGYFRATYDTMAEQIGCHVDTIRAAMQDENSEFSKAYKNGFSSMKMKLSEAQVKTAIEEHNPTLLVWLGKQYLNQKDNPMPDEDANKNYTVILVPRKQAESDNN